MGCRGGEKSTLATGWGRQGAGVGSESAKGKGKGRIADFVGKGRHVRQQRDGFGRITVKQPRGTFRGIDNRGFGFQGGSLQGRKSVFQTHRKFSA